jgi:hypothetical protein
MDDNAVYQSQLRIRLPASCLPAIHSDGGLMFPHGAIQAFPGASHGPRELYWFLFKEKIIR